MAALRPLVLFFNKHSKQTNASPEMLNYYINFQVLILQKLFYSTQELMVKG